MVVDPTRDTSTSVTLIDHMYSTNPTSLIKVTVPSYAPGVDYPVSCTVNKFAKLIRDKSDSHFKIKYRNFRTFNDEMFLQELERGVQGMDAQTQFIENDKLEKQKIKWQKQIDDLKENHLQEKHDRKYNILIYGIDDSKKDENVYTITRKLFSEDMHIDNRKQTLYSSQMRIEILHMGKV
ncbi:unnamed protein product [Mytilus coruscus]|uniref:Uncharacterized protein n=1 Tax=Mytilus coruscus TaxID=42192 RepID=A0A6J8D0S1_MYTCO|nr:unnamed protein product [Mytilus coruscus]